MGAYYKNINDLLGSYGLYEYVFDAVINNDSAEVVSKVINIIKVAELSASINREFKSEDKSVRLRKEGNKAFQLNLFSDALQLYNKALSFAPSYSRAKKLAYSNRSALLYKTGHFDACLKDIEKCMSLVCPDDIAEKLNNRKIDCLNKLQKTPQAEKIIKNFFSFNVERNSSIPCASTMVEVIREQQFPKVVAATDVQTGTVLALESSFVSEVDHYYAYVSCYYCQKISLNLDPCCDCSLAMFCSKDCQDKCMTDYHAVECVLTPLFKDIIQYNCHSVYLKTVIKSKSKFNSWNDFIIATNNVGVDSVKDYERVKEYTTSDIYDGNNKYASIIWYKDTSQSLNYGIIFNAAVYFAFALYELIHYSSFFPDEESEKLRALRAVSRLLMYFATCKPNILKPQVPGHDLLLNDQVGAVTGFYPFVCKLTDSCKPNVYGIQLNSKIALVALRPIKKGTELTYSRVMWADCTGEIKRATVNYNVYKILCKCQICVEDWNMMSASSKRSDLSDQQRSYLYRTNLLEVCVNLENRYKLEECYKKLCEGLSVFGDAPCSKGFVLIFRLFQELSILMLRASN